MPGLIPTAPRKRGKAMDRKTEYEDTAALTSCGQNLTFANFTRTHDIPLGASKVYVSEGLSFASFTVYPPLCKQSQM